MSIIETPQYKGIFEVLTHPGYTTEQIRSWVERGRDVADMFCMQVDKKATNILMASVKLAMANAVFPTIDRLVITNQTVTPSDAETSYTGVIYETAPTEEYFRNTGGNPFSIGWNIRSSDADGVWGSFILVDAGGNMINRALAGTTKQAGTAKIVRFTGTVS